MGSSDALVRFVRMDPQICTYAPKLQQRLLILFLLILFYICLRGSPSETLGGPSWGWLALLERLQGVVNLAALSHEVTLCFRLYGG